MADLDSLNIKINASATSATTAIEKLKSSLGTLSSALNNYLDETEAVKGLTNLADGLEKVTAAISNLDTRKLREISQAMNGLSRASANLDKAGKSASTAEKAFDKLAQRNAAEWADGYKIPLKGLTAAIKDVYKAAGDDAALNKAKNDLEDYIKTNTNFAYVLDDQKRLLEDLARINSSGQKVHLPQGVMSEMGDDYRSVRALLGKAFTSGPGIMDIDEFVSQMNNSLVQVGNTAQDTFSNLVSAAHQAKKEMDGINFFELGSSQRDMNENYIHNYIESIVASANKLKNSQAEQSIQNISNAAQNASQNSDAMTRLSNGLKSIADIQVNADLGTNLGTLSSAISRIGTPTAQTGIQNMYQLKGAVASLDGIVVPQIGEQLATLGAGIAKLGGKYVTNAATALPFIADGLKQLGSVSLPEYDVTSIANLAESIGKFGQAKVEKAVANMPQLTKELVNLIKNINSIGNVDEKTVRLTQAVAQLTQAYTHLNTNQNRVHSSGSRLPGIFSKISASAKKTRPHVFSLASAIGKIYATYWMLFRFAGKIKEAVNISSDLTEVQNVVDNVFGSMTKSADDFAKSAINDLGMSELQAKQMASRFQAMGKAMQISNKQVADASGFLANKLREDAVLYDRNAASAAGMSLNLTRLAADMASFYNVDYEEVADDLASVYTGMSRPLRRYGLDLTENTLREYAMKNGLDANIKSMTQAQKTLLRYQYVLANTTAAQGDFARTAHTWANQVRILKQNFIQLGAVIGTAFINSLKPMVMAFNNAFNTILDLTQKAVNALGKLLGWQIEIQDVGVTFDDAVDGMDDYTDATEDAADAQKKLNSNLQAFDKLNVLTTKTDKSSGNDGTGTGSGTGGGSQATGGGVRVLPYESDIDSWYDFGKRIADKIADALWNINWDRIKEGARNAAHNLAEFINGFIDTDSLWTGIGHTIAQGLNTALAYANTLLTEIKWDKLGEQIANSFNTFIDEFDWEGLGEFFGNAVNAVSDFIKGFAENFDADGLGKGIAATINSFFETWEPDDTADAINGVVDKIEEFIAGFLGDLDTEKMFSKFKEFWENLKADTIVKLIEVATWTTLTGGIAKGIAATIATEFATQFAAKLATELGLKLGEKDLAKIIEGTVYGAMLGLKFAGPSGAIIGALVGGPLNALFAELDKKKEWENIYGQEEGDRLYEENNKNKTLAASRNASIPGMQSRYAQMEESSRFWDKTFSKIFKGYDEWSQKIKGLQEQGKQTRAEAEADRNEKIANFKEKFNTAVEEIKGYWAEKWDGVKEWFETNVEPWFTKEKWSEVFDNFKTSLKEKWDETVGQWTTDVQTWWDENVAPWFTAEKWVGIYENIKTQLKTTWDNTVGEWKTNIQTWWDENVAPWFTVAKWTELYQNIKTELKTTWDNTVEQWKTGIQNWWDNDVTKWFKKETWIELYESVKTSLKETWDETVGQWQTDIKNWWDNDVAKWFEKDTWVKLYESVKSSLKETWDETVGQWQTDIQEWWDNDVAKWFEYDTWLTLYENVKTALKDTWDNTVGQWQTDIQAWWDEHVAPWFEYDQWYNAMGGIADAFADAFKDAANGAIGFINDMIQGIEDTINGIIEKYNDLADTAKDVPLANKVFKKVNRVSLEEIPELTFANGGFPAPGLFIAGESGPELVGTIGGRTAVVNNDQIVAAVSQGVAQAVAGVLGSQNSTQELTVNLDGREIYRSVVSHDRQFKRSTGESAFAY